ncbi:DUF1491 family protein [Nitratireductor pacificus]|uniref:DUF1491 family protein n=1 Tax=Nitratireductor pacificus pht-3B TaxID=391937 RepID=K2MCB2_9HYPH|nr:DUF1491 family protein [Nitratireductor pacificus]EKF19791.1 hypothetical protein NA2_05603 [Nitratireductor pacificus pht-3B]
MRLTSEFWVSALTKRIFAEGGFAAVGQRGAREAGSIFIVVRDRMGRQALYGPAMQASYAETRPAGRQFTLIVVDEGQEIEQRLDKERRFDPDFWVVEIELNDIGQAGGYFDVAAE